MQGRDLGRPPSAGLASLSPGTRLKLRRAGPSLYRLLSGVTGR